MSVAVALGHIEQQLQDLIQMTQLTRRYPVVAVKLAKMVEEGKIPKADKQSIFDWIQTPGTGAAAPPQTLPDAYQQVTKVGQEFTTLVLAEAIRSIGYTRGGSEKSLIDTLGRFLRRLEAENSVTQVKSANNNKPALWRRLR